MVINDLYYFYDFEARRLIYLLQKNISPKIFFTDVVKWYDEYPYHRLNIYDGIPISQVQGVYLAFNKDWLSKFDTIIEIGSYNGGLSSYLYDVKKEDSVFVSYDIDPDINIAKSKRERHEIDFRIGDCFEEKYYNEIKELIQREGKTLLVCDGGNKTKEFIEFSKYMKSGDVIVLHDYKDENEEIVFTEAKQYWQWPYLYECSFESVKEAVQENNLKKYDYDKFLFYLWGCFIKS